MFDKSSMILPSSSAPQNLICVGLSEYDDDSSDNPEEAGSDEESDKNDLEQFSKDGDPERESEEVDREHSSKEGHPDLENITEEVDCLDESQDVECSSIPSKDAIPSLNESLVYVTI